MRPKTAVLAATPTVLRRICALCYEIVLLIAVMWVSGWVFIGVWSIAGGGGRYQGISLYIYEWAVVFAYFGFCWVKGGQTLAMKTWRIKLRRRDGLPISWRQALIRYHIVWVMFIPLPIVAAYVAYVQLPGYCFWLALIWAVSPYLWALVDRDKQFLHDRLIGARLQLAQHR